MSILKDLYIVLAMPELCKVFLFVSLKLVTFNFIQLSSSKELFVFLISTILSSFSNNHNQKCNFLHIINNEVNDIISKENLK